MRLLRKRSLTPRSEILTIFLLGVSNSFLSQSRCSQTLLCETKEATPHLPRTPARSKPSHYLTYMDRLDKERKQQKRAPADSRSLCVSPAACSAHTARSVRAPRVSPHPSQASEPARWNVKKVRGQPVRQWPLVHVKKNVAFCHQRWSASHRRGNRAVMRRRSCAGGHPRGHRKNVWGTPFDKQKGKHQLRETKDVAAASDGLRW